MSQVRCLYCDTENDAVQTAGYCESCGKKLPPASLAHKRREPILYEPHAGPLPPAEHAASPQASALLFTAGILNLLGCGLLIVLAPLLVPREQLRADFIPEMLLAGVAVLLIFAVLGWWARRHPWAAALTGLIVYLGLVVLEVLTAPGLALRGAPVKIIVLVLLIQALRSSRRPDRLAAGL